MTRPTLPLRLTQKDGQPASLVLGGVDISRYVARDGLRIDYETGGPLSMPPQPVVTITFGFGSLDLDFDVDLLEQWLDAAQVKAAG